MNPESIGIFVLTLVGVSPLVGLLWKAFNTIASIRQELQRTRDLNDHLNDKQDLAINGLKELIEHRSVRLQGQVDDLSRRHQNVFRHLDDMERYLEKTTEFKVNRRAQ